MKYVDSGYLSMARRSELLHHERTMDRLQRQVAHLTKAVAWEMEQHQTRLKELQRVEDTLAEESQVTLATPNQPTLQPIPSSSRKRAIFRKHIQPGYSNAGR